MASSFTSLLSFFCAGHRCPGAGAAGAASVRGARAAPRCLQPFQLAPMDTLQATAEPPSPERTHWKTQLNTGQNTAWQRWIGGWKVPETAPQAPQADEGEGEELLPATERRLCGQDGRSSLILFHLAHSSSHYSPHSSLKRPVGTLRTRPCMCTPNGGIRKWERRKRAEEPRVSAVGDGPGLGRGTPWKDRAQPPWLPPSVGLHSPTVRPKGAQKGLNL